jgi:succinate dehydrogenase/fumarate reductase flavoprotein subunit
MSEADLEVDVVVLGSGIAGMTVAGTAAENGLSVLVADRAPTLGGSSVWSGGFVWTALNEEDFLAFDPDGDVRKFHLMRDGFEAAVEWVRSQGILVGPVMNEVLGFGSGHVVDVPHFVRHVKAIVESHDGWVMPSTEGVELLTADGRVTGVVLRDAESGETTTVAAGAVVVATGGIHASEPLRQEFGIAGAENLMVRGNPYSEGAGVQLARAVGAGATLDKGYGFYGHPMPYPLDRIDPSDRTSLAMYHSEFSIVLDHEGKRFFDESDGYWTAAMEIAPRRTAILVTDEQIRQEQILHPTRAGYDHDLETDKMSLAGERGGNYARVESLDELAAAVDAWGYDGAAAVESLREFNEQVVADPESVSPPRKRNRAPLATPPYEVIEVQGTITFAMAGLLTDDDGRVLGDAGEPIEGLYAAGIDAALNAYCSTGGLVRGLVLGRRVGASIVSSSSVASVELS